MKIKEISPKETTITINGEEFDSLIAGLENHQRQFSMRLRMEDSYQRDDKQVAFLIEKLCFNRHRLRQLNEVYNFGKYGTVVPNAMNNKYISE